jgi:hypothetical protein
MVPSVWVSRGRSDYTRKGTHRRDAVCELEVSKRFRKLSKLTRNTTNKQTRGGGWAMERLVRALETSKMSTLKLLFLFLKSKGR